MPWRRREQQRIRNGGRLERQIDRARQACRELTRPAPGTAHGRLGDDEPEQDGGAVEDECFGDDLRDHARPARSQRVADDDLRLAHRRAGEVQRRDVRRDRPQQQQDDGVDHKVFELQRITRVRLVNARTASAAARGGRGRRQSAPRRYRLRRGILPARFVGEGPNTCTAAFARRRVLDRELHRYLPIAREAETWRHHLTTVRAV